MFNEVSNDQHFVKLTGEIRQEGELDNVEYGIDDSRIPRELVLITDNEIFTTIEAIQSPSRQGVKLWFNFTNDTVIWIKSFDYNIPSDYLEISTCLYSSTNNRIYSLTSFQASNKVILYTLNSMTGDPLLNPYIFPQSADRTSGIVLIDNKIYFSVGTNTQSYLVVFSPQAQSSQIYSFSTSTPFNLQIQYISKTSDNSK